MPFANPHVCPSCGGTIAGELVCPHCSLDLNSAPARQLWQTLLQADALLAEARAVGEPTTPSEPASIAEEAVVSTTAGLPAYHQSPRATTVHASRSLSPGSILLGLGALFILVAGFIFVTVSWGSLGVAGRAVVLLAFTALSGALARWVSRRGLAGSAEALWAVFLGLVTLDWFAAHAQGFVGLDNAPFLAIALIWTALAFALASLIVVSMRSHVGRRLVTPMLVAGGAPWYGAAVLGTSLDGWTLFWAALLVTAFAALFLVIAVRLRHVVTGTLLAALTAIAAAVAAVAAVVEAFDHPSGSELIRDAHGAPVLILIMSSVAVGLTVRRATAIASAIALWGVGLLFALPIEDVWPGRGAFVTVAVAVVIAAVASGRADQWSRGGRLAASVASVGLLIAALPWLANLLSAIGDGASEFGEAPFWQRAGVIEVSPGPAWLAAVVFAAVAISVHLSTRWPEASPIAPIVRSVGWLIAGAGTASAVAAGGAPYVVLAAVVVGVGLALAVVLVGGLGWSLIGVAVVAFAPVIPLVSRSASLSIWVLAGLALLAISLRSSDIWRREASAFAGSGWLMGAAGIAALLCGADDRTVSLILVVVAAVALGIACIPLRGRPMRLGVEAASAFVAAAGQVYAANQDVSLSWQSVAWLVTGAVLVLLSFVTPDRRWLRCLGSGALGVAYVLRLVASDIKVVEAYTLPFGLVLLVGGLWAIRRPETPSSLTALAPAVSLILVPSLPQALADPARPRAVALLSAALVMVLAGVRFQWLVPFVAGSAVLVLLGFANLGPYAWAVPRWVLIAAAGAILLGVGVTWEDRVRDGRKFATYVRSMR